MSCPLCHKGSCTKLCKDGKKASKKGKEKGAKACGKKGKGKKKK